MKSISYSLNVDLLKNKIYLINVSKLIEENKLKCIASGFKQNIQNRFKKIEIINFFLI
jgi:hypothetical protein